MPDKPRILNPLVDNGIDPVTGLTSTKGKKSPIDFTSLVGTAAMMSEGSQDVGNYFDTNSKYDNNITRSDLDNLERERALKQPTTAKAFNAVVGGVASGLLTAVEDFGYILDFENNIKRLTGAEHVEQNWLGSTMQNLKEGLAREMPIYRLNSDKVFDWSDPGFYFSSLKGILDSAVGFAIPGMAASKGIGAIQRGLRMSKYLEFLKTSKGAEQIINSLASGYITNFAEGKMMAVEQFENSMNTLEQGLVQDIFEQYKSSNPDTPAEELYKMAQKDANEQLDKGLRKNFESIAGEEANKFMTRNKVFMLTDAIGLHGIHKGAGFTRALIKDKGFTAWAKRFGELSSDNLLLQAGKEGIEEISQNVLQMEGEYQAAKKAGKDVSATPDNLAERVYQFATSEQALLEGMMGLFGGGPQRILTEAVSGNLSKSSRDQKAKQYQDQQDQIAKNTEYLNSKLGSYAKAQALRAEAIAKGEDNLAEFIKNNQFLTLATENFARGTTERLERSLQDIINGVSEEERIANGWDENYQEQAQEQLDELKKLESAYNKYTRYENQAEVFQNRETRRLLQRDKELINARLEDINMSLDREDEQKDPELVKEKTYQERQLKRVSEHIANFDNQYREMTSAKSQQSIRKQKEEIIKAAREAGKDLREKRKKEAQERAAEERKKRNEKKEKLQEEGKKEVKKPIKKEEQEEEKEVAPDIKEEPTESDINVSVLSEPVEDEGPDPNQLTEPTEDELSNNPDIKNMNPDEVIDQEKRKVSQDQFDSASDKLFDDFEKNFKPEVIIEGEGISANQKRVGLLEIMMEKAAEVKGKQDITFDELIDMLLDRHGKKRVGLFYTMIQGLWVQNHPNHVWINSLEDHLKLTPDEKKELEDSKKESKTIFNGQFTNATAAEVTAEFDQVNKEVAESANPSSGFELEYLRVESGSGILAYLSRLYKQTRDLFFVQRKDVDNYINSELQDKGILDPDKYPIGTEITLVVEDNDDIKVYVDSSTTGEKIRTTWGAKKASWKNNRVQGEKQRYNQLYEEEVPIAVYAGSQKIGYLHETSWINNMNIHGDVVKDKERSRKIRKYIVKNGVFETTISDRTSGFLWRVANKQLVTTNEALPDPTLPILVVKNGSLHTSRNELYTGTILNKAPLREGIAYTIIPSAQGPLAVPLMNKKLSENPNIAATIRKVLEIYTTNDNSSEAQAIINEVFNTTGKNITTAVGLSEFINMFIHLTDVGKGNLNLENYLIKHSTDEQQKDGFATSFIRNGGLDLQFETALGRGIRPLTVSKASIKELSAEKRKLLFDGIEKNLNAMFINISLDSIGEEEKKVFIQNEDTKSYKDYVRSMTKSAFLGQNIAEEGQPPKYVYNVQPVITLDFNKIDGNDKQTGKPNITEANESVEGSKSKQNAVSEILSKFTGPNSQEVVRKTAAVLEKFLPEKVGKHTISADGTFSNGGNWRIAYESIATDGNISSQYASLDADVLLSGDEDIIKKHINERLEKNYIRENKEGIAIRNGVTTIQNEDQTKEEGPKYDTNYEGDMDFTSDFEESLMPKSIIALGDLEVEKVKELAEVTEIGQDEVKGVIISAFGSAAKQDQIIDYVRSKIVDRIFKEKRVSRNKAFKEIKSHFVSNLSLLEFNLKVATEANDQIAIDRFTKAIAEVNLILDNWGKIERLVIKQMNRIDNIKVIERDNEITEEEEEAQNETAHYSEAAVFTTPPTDRLAPQIKQFLSGIGKWKEDPNNEGQFIPDKNYFGAQRTMDFWDVYNILQRITPNRRPSFEELMRTLKDHSEAFPFLNEVITKLENAPEQIRNQFVSSMTNHYVDMKFITFGRNSSGSFELKELDSDANAIQRVILNDWNGKILERIGNINAEGDDIILDQVLANALIATWKRFEKTHKYTIDEIAGWFHQLGIDLTEYTWRDIEAGKYKHLGKVQTLQNFVENTVMKILANHLGKMGDTSLVLGGNRIIDQNVIKSLARYDAKYRTSSFSNSHKSGLKTVYSYSLNKFLVNRVRELKEGSLVKLLSKLSFNGQSVWGNALMNDQSGFKDNFNHWTVSLEALKKDGSKSKNNRELNNLSEAEIELVKIGMLQADREDLSGKNQRIIRVLYPTTSDKTTAMGLTVVAQKLVLDPDGNISDESIDMLVDVIARPEITRIKMFQAKAKMNLKGYNKGASQFLMFPEFNTLTWTDKNGVVQKMFNGDGSINGDIGSPESMSAIRNAVRTHFNSLLEEKLALWNKNGIGTNPKTGAFQYLHQSFLMGTTAKGANPLVHVNVQSKVKAAATDMIFQYLIANAEIHKMFTGDPALYYKQASVNKGKAKTNAEYDFVADAEETYANINKRLAADIAPGMELAEADGDMYTQAILKDSPSASLARFEITEILDGKEAADNVREEWKKFQNGTISEDQFNKSIKGLISEKYYSFDGTDAQEYTTWEEHLHVMRQLGEISEEEYKSAYETLKAGNDLGRELMGKVMQPMKPVYVDNQIDESNDVEKRIYIKSSAFPLFPQLTRGLSLDNLRQAMENQKVSRAAFMTAVKLGGIDNATDIWSDDGRVLSPDKISFAGSTLTLNRKGFRIQQRVPYDPKKSVINKVTQASKNLFVNMLEVEGFVFEGKEYTGAELQNIYYDIYGRLHQIERDALVEEVGYNEETGRIADISKLRALLIQESRERGYPLSDQELIELDKELKFLAFSSSANKYESLLNSLVTSRIIRLKMPGKSFVLGSEEGFKGLLTETKEEIATREGIVFTSAYDPKVGLKPSRIENGQRKPSQALVPWKFKTKDGKKVSITKYIKDGKIDLTKVPEEVLQLFGMRIPNQGPNSQAWIEIVGFLPEAAGDLLIATRDFVVQMGSDFDVDKLYTYMYGYYFDNEGNIKIHREVKETNEADVLKNKIIDIHLAIHKNNDHRVQSQIVSPLDTRRLKTWGNDITELRKKRQISESSEGTTRLYTGLSDDTQRRKFKEGTAGKSGVGVFSLDNMFNAIAQGRNLKFMISSKEALSLQIGESISTGELSREKTLNGKDYISDIIAEYQSAAVDNAKEPILDKLNINTYTFKVIKILNQLGFTEEVAYILAQDSIIDYVNELERMSSSMAEFNRNREEAAYAKVLEKYKVPDYDTRVHGKFAAEEATIKNLKSYIELGSKAPNYNYAQIAILDLFRKLNEYGQKIQTLQSTLNPDSRGVGKSVLESIIKEDQVYELANNTDIHIANASSLVGEMIIISPETEKEFRANGYSIRKKNNLIYAIKPKTINGHAIVYGLFTANDMWSNLFPYQTSVIETMFKKIEKLTKASGNRIGDRAERRKDIWNNFKSFVYSGRNLGLYDSSITIERERLLYDRWKIEKGVDEHGFSTEKRIKIKDSLGSFLLKIKETGFAKNNPFLSKLTVDVNLTGGPTIIKFNASAAENLDETNIYAAIVDMLTKTDGTGASPIIGEFNGNQMTLRGLAQELILYAYITGGIQEAVQFVKYIPASYLVTMPFARQLGEIKFLDSEFGINPNENPLIDYYYNIPPFVEQFIQHNPDQVPTVTLDDITDANVKNITSLVTFTLKPTTLQRIGESILLKIDPETSSLDLYPPAYVSIQSDKSEKKYKLYKFDYAEKKYIQIDTLGSFANDEYNADVPKQISLVRKNKANPYVKEEGPAPKTGNPLGDTVDDDMDVTPDMLKEDKETVTSVLDSLKRGTMSALKRTDGKTAIKELLNEAKAKSKNPYMVQLVQEIYNSLDLLPDKVSVDFTNRVNLSTAGYYTLTKTKQGDDPHTLVLNTSGLSGKSTENIIETIIHELIHGLTSYKIKHYWFTKTNDQDRLKALIKDSPMLEVSPREKEIIQNIEVLWRHAKNVVTSNPEVRRAYERFVDKVLKHEQGEHVIFSKEEVGTFYGLTSISEFVSVALTNQEFAEILNNIVAPNKQKTVLQSLLEKLSKLLQAITGFNAKEGSVLEQTIYNVLDLINKEDQSSLKIEGINISSYESGLGRDLSNFASLPITFRGKKYANSETAYQDQKKTLPNLSDENVYKLMVEILSDKLTQHSKLFDEIRDRGGMDFLDKSTHNLVKQGNIIKQDRWTGQNGLFMRALKEAFGLVQFDRSAQTEEEVTPETKTFVENGTYYKFTVKDGVPVEGWFSQGNPYNWKPITVKTLYSAYQRLLAQPVREINIKATLEENQMTLPNGTIITFNDEQIAALDALREWMKSGDTYFTLSGYAGTGKTTIIRKALDSFLPRSIAVSAPTHKAKRVIQATTDRTGVTIHALLNIKPDMDVDNLDPNNLEFARDKNAKNPPKISNFRMVIIDEASMMNKGLFKLLLSEAKKYGTRVIFMGDQAQIPPVGETLSEVFTSPEVKHKAHLQKVERQADGNPLFGIYDAIRNDIHSSKDKFDHETKLNDKGEGIFFTSNHGVFAEKVIEAFTSQEYEDDPNAFKVITYTNKVGDGNVAYWNKIIRTARMPDAKLFIEVGDILMGYKTIGREDEIVLENAADYKVTERSELITDSRGIQGYKVVLENTFDGEESRVFIISRSAENLAKYRSKLAELAEKAKVDRPVIGGRAWIPYFRFKESYVLFGDIMDEDGTVAVAGDINYGYAITAHKSQGSTYKTVFIDENNINKYDQWSEQKHVIERKRKKLSPLTKEDVDTERNKIKYVALSRPSQSAVVFSMKTTSEKNTFVQKPVVDIPVTEDDNLDVNQLPDDITAFDSFDPKSIVSDQELNEFMKRCKGL